MTQWSAFCQPPNSYTTSWDSTDWLITMESLTSESTTSTGRRMPHAQLALLSSAEP